MRRLLFILVFASGILPQQLASAQSAEAIQLALNIQKLSQLKGILSSMKGGYEVVSKGYGLVKNISEGNFKMHDAFLYGLLTVNPNLRKYRKVAGIIEYQVSILREYKSAYSGFKSRGRFRPEELAQLYRTYESLLERSLRNIDELTMVLTAAELRMSDDERLNAIDRLYDNTQDMLGFLRSYNKRNFMLEGQRQRQIEDATIIKDIYGLQ